MKNLRQMCVPGLRFAMWTGLLIFTLVFAKNASAKVVGTVKSVNGNTIIITTDAGSEVTITIADSARILQATPGQTDLKSATAIPVSEIKVGDRVAAPGEGPSITASALLVMKQSDIATRQQQEREQWRRGVDGLVKDVNASAGAITITNAAGKSITVHVSPATQIRRYSPDSVKFDDAKPGTLAEIKPGDQLRARGEKNADGTEFTAQALVTGTFRQIAGTVISTDAPNNTITVMDLVARKPVTLKVTSDSQMHKLPPFVAQRIAMRLKGGAPGANGGAAAQSGAGNSNSPQAQAGPGGQPRSGQGNWAGGGGPNGPGGAGGFRPGAGAPDFQQMLSRMPSV